MTELTLPLAAGMRYFKISKAAALLVEDSVPFLRRTFLKSND
jgi:hypothetical protein